MVFVDGTNLLVELINRYSLEERAETPSDEVINLASKLISQALSGSLGTIGACRVVRKYWFGSRQGSDEDIQTLRILLKRYGYDSSIYPKRKGRNEKGVDLAVAREMLMQAFHRNYEVAVLVGGDADYVGLVEDVKRLGRTCVGVFPNGNSMSDKLLISLDRYFEIAGPAEVLTYQLAKARAQSAD
ncbi:NYN domain-containing protein [Methyloversatilis sp. XJ19-49]|uniref:NYN domain-containing protein n=1 Tax=Methyloversatilis sp. XJ19-49 TaxID=2963429 RepID=UPI00211CBE27|nr:NYN domain-containing protein [Methyloversatilis sp. XJ19-49]MCQ9378788.1 NYN domain-containing protein [Methyloversatilis sp. XJ19-49]